MKPLQSQIILEYQKMPRETTYTKLMYRFLYQEGRFYFFMIVTDGICMKESILSEKTPPECI